jgi:hypothetical protein
MAAIALDRPGRLERAIAEGEWVLVAHYLLLGVSRAAARLPPEALSELLDLLAPAAPGREDDRGV